MNLVEATNGKESDMSQISNLELFNSGLKTFADFANAAFVANDKTAICKLSGGQAISYANLGPATDFKGNIFRGAGNVATNNDVRTLFYKNVVDQFGGEGNIPDSVKDALKIEKFSLNENGRATSGKPLTAERIAKVLKAIVKETLMNPKKVLDNVVMRLEQVYSQGGQIEDAQEESLSELVPPDAARAKMESARKEARSILSSFLGNLIPRECLPQKKADYERFCGSCGEFMTEIVEELAKKDGSKSKMLDKLQKLLEYAAQSLSRKSAKYRICVYLLACAHQRIDDILAGENSKASGERLLGYDQYEDYSRMRIDWIKSFEIDSAEDRLGIGCVRDFDNLRNNIF